MNLSQIIAKDSHYDRRIPLEGHWDVWVKIENGNVANVKITEDIREADKKKGGALHHQQRPGTM